MSFAIGRRFSLALLSWLVLVAVCGFVNAAGAGELSARDQATYRAAFAAVLADRWSEARKIAATAKDPLPGKVIQWLDLTRPGPGRSFDEMTAFLAQNPDWPRREALIRQAERAMPEFLPPEKIARWFDGRAPMTADGALRLLGAYLALKQRPLAEKTATEAWINLNFDRVQEDTFKRRFGHLVHQSADIARLDRLLWEGQTDQAIWMLSRVDDAHRALARARMKLAASTPDVEQAVAQVPKSLRSDPGLIFERARWNRRKGNDMRAAELLDPPPANVSDPDRFWGELERAARAAFERGDYKRAYKFAAGHGAISGESFAEAEFLAGWLALRHLHDGRSAVTHFQRLYENSRSPITRARGAYWTGRAFDALADGGAAQSWYQKSSAFLLTFYGQLAAARLNAGESLPLPPTPKPTTSETSDFEKNELVRVIRTLGSLDQSEYAKPFLLRLAESTDSPTRLKQAAELAISIGRKDFAIQVAKAARLSGVELTEYLYPMAKIDVKDTPEPALILGVIRQESAFDPAAVSPAGAKGLMQLMPSTAKAVARRSGIEFREADLTGNANYNIALGRAYLRQVINDFGGSYVLAAAAYNAGPNRVVEWIRRFGDPRHDKVDMLDWIESVPFDETRNYIQRVIEGLHIYRARLNGNALTPVAEQDIGRAIEG